MTIQQWEQYVQNKIIYLDGATGSNLMKRGMPSGVCPEQWIMEHTEVLKGLQEEYVAAGSNIIYAPTFTANRIKLAEYGLENQVEEINHKLVAISKEAANGKALVAGDLTMTGRQLAPVGDMEFEQLISVYKEQIQALESAGVDLLIVETMMSLQETRAAVIAAKEVSELPVMATLTFEGDSRTLFGTDAVTAVTVLQSLGVCAIGANCSSGPDKLKAIIEKIKDVAVIPIIAKPNAGIPALDQNGNTVYDMPPKVFAEEMKGMIEAGASILGGCCGTSPEYINMLVQETKNMKPVQAKKQQMRRLASERKTVSFDLQGSFMIIGERINPTGKKKLQEQLRAGDLEMVCDFAQEQEEKGASLLDINLGMSGIDEKEMLLQAMEEVSMVSQLPLCIDSSHAHIIEAALRCYPGRALINSISCEKAKMEALLPVAKKYGAMFILLPLSEKGLPESVEEKHGMIRELMEKALELGLQKEDIIVDGLVSTVGANKLAAMETLQTIRYCKEELGLATVVGLSNISFGLPERSYINSTFLTLAIGAGLTMAIANPSQELLVNSALATDLLLHKDKADLRYIEHMGAIKVKDMPVQSNENKENTKQSQVYESVLKGNRKGILNDTKQAILEGKQPADLLNKELLPAINEVGELFDKGTYFLPQLIASAEAMKIAIEYLEPMLMEKADTKAMPVVVIATVEGDIHDIGKNLVGLMLKNHGFHVVDLGKDVPKEEIIQAAKEHYASIIGLSALMTTTMQEMKNVIAYAKQEGITAKFMIGGAVTTQEYAEEIGADGYSSDAAQAVKLAKKLCGLN